MASPITANSDAEISPGLTTTSDSFVIAAPSTLAPSDAEIVIAVQATSDAEITTALMADSDAEVVLGLQANSNAFVIDQFTMTATSNAEVSGEPSPPEPPPLPPPPDPGIPPGPPPVPVQTVRTFFNSGNCNINDCFPCNVLPTINASAEAPDIFADFVTTWGNPWINEPKLGTLFKANGCQTICESVISQTDAFLCAQRQQVECMKHNQESDPQPQPVCLTPPCEAPPTPPDIPPVEDFGNSQQSCNASCPDGAPFTFTQPAGSFLAFDQVTADRMAKSFACRQAQLQNTCLNLVTTLLCQDIPTAIVIVGTGASLDGSNNIWQLMSGALPAGFTLGTITEGPTLILSGTPTAFGDSTFSIRVTAPNGNFAERTFTISVAAITPSDPELPGLVIGTPYSVEFAIVGATVIDPMWTISEGELPDGLDLDNETGEISGTPTEQGDFTFTVTVSSGTASSTTFNCQKEFHIGGCFIDASPNLNLDSNVTIPYISRTGGLVVFTDSVLLQAWYYLDHSFQQNPITVFGSTFKVNEFSASGRYIVGQENNGVDSHIVWIDLDTLTGRDLGDTSLAGDLAINDNGDVAFGGASSFIYYAASNTTSPNLQPAFLMQSINNNTDASGNDGGGNVHALFRSAVGVIVDIHPGASGPGITSLPGGPGNANFKNINSAGHIVGHQINAGAQRVFTNLGGASIFVSGVIAGGIGRAFINDADQISYNNLATGECFFYEGGLTASFGIQGTLAGMNNSGVCVGFNASATNAWIYTRGITLGFPPFVEDLIDKIPDAAAQGWTSIKIVYDISDDNYVAGIGVLNGVDTPFVAKLCL